VVVVADAEKTGSRFDGDAVDAVRLMVETTMTGAIAFGRMGEDHPARSHLSPRLWIVAWQHL